MRNSLMLFFSLLTTSCIFCQTGVSYNTCEEAGQNPVLTVDQLEDLVFSLPPQPNATAPTPLCFNGGGAAHNTTWISFIAGDNAQNFDIEIKILDCFQGIQWGIVSDCEFTSVICDGACSFDAATVSIVTDLLIPCHQYWLWVDGCNGFDCDFEFVVNDGFEDFVPSITDNCDELCSQSLFPITDLDGGIDFSCLAGTMMNATPNTSFMECGFDTIPTVWFKVETDFEAAYLFANITPQNGATWDPIFAIYSGDCPSLNPLFSTDRPHCNNDWPGGSNTNQINQIVDDLETYWIAIGALGNANDINANPGFDLCVATTIDLISCLGNESCNPVADWELLNSDIDTSDIGPIDLNNPPELCPGETIEICIEFLHDATLTGVDGLAGIIPFFGDGWDQTAFEPTLATVIGSEQFPDWFDEGVPILQEDLSHLCTYTDQFGILQICNTFCRACPCQAGLPAGSPLPGGWFWVSEGALSGCENDGTPGEGYGIGFVVNNVDLCLSLTVRNDFADALACEQADLTFGIQTFSDGVAGCWEDPEGECVLDIDQFVKFKIKCSIDTFFEDLDGDGFGTDLVTTTGCVAPIGFASQDGDCDDTNALIYPGAIELCDLLDNDCDGTIDNDVMFQNYYADTDEDGFGDPNVIINDCIQPQGYVTNNADCDDTNANINPDATEICDGLDNNCNGQMEEGLTFLVYFADNDQDGFGDINDNITDCIQPQGYITNSTDCDDTNANINPDATEICDGFDNNCDGQIDEGFNFQDYFADTDQDGFGDPNAIINDCIQPQGYVTDNTDCNDTNANVNPNTSEICDGFDNNCDGQIDEGFNFQDYFADTDQDGFGDPNVIINDCTQPQGYVTDNTDCDDTSANINPDTSEICDGFDNNCDGQIDEGLATMNFYLDGDEDGFGNLDSLVVDCQQPAGYVLNNTDCDDFNPDINPDAVDMVNNGIDEDCDGMDATSGTYDLNGYAINIFPNPTNEIVNIDSSEPLNLEIQVYDLSGKLLQEKKGDSFDFSSYPAGIYLMKLCDKETGNYIVERIVVYK